MPTQEENIPILLGIASGQERDIRRIQVGVMSLDSRFEEHGKKLDQILLLLNTLTSQPGQEA